MTTPPEQVADYPVPSDPVPSDPVPSDPVPSKPWSGEPGSHDTDPMAGGATRATRPVRRRASRQMGLGSGLTQVPDAPDVNPRDAVLAEPVLPEDRRECSGCRHRVGARRFGRPGRVRGYCTQCGTRFDFEPQLHRGDILSEQYEVVGCLAYGGQGWVYLAVDRRVENRWVAIKGLLNVADQRGAEAVRAELAVLARVAHPAIVKIYNFISHQGTDYIVMEYIGGRSLKESIGQRGPGGPRRAAGGGALMRVDHALAYLIEVLSALQYLHDLQLIYCDLKPDNIIHSGSYVRVIDLGAVRGEGDLRSQIYGTYGFQAPEIPKQAVPSVASDIYTVGRTLLLLTCDVPHFTRDPRLPAAAEAPALNDNDAFRRLVVKACDPDPANRFRSADEMRIQALGVLREVVAARSPQQRRADSLVGSTQPDPGAAAGVPAPPVVAHADPFGGPDAGPPRVSVRAEPGPSANPEVFWAAGSDTASVSHSFSVPGPASLAGAWRELPAPLPDRDDAAAALLATIAGDDARVRLDRLAPEGGSALVGPESFEIPLEAARAAIDLADLGRADEFLDHAAALLARKRSSGHADEVTAPYRLPWWRGVLAGVRGDADAAASAFDEVYGDVPGELAPKLALGFAHELAGRADLAERCYRICLHTDPAYIPAAAFGLARLRQAGGDDRGARALLELVPTSASASRLARQQITRLLLTAPSRLPDVAEALLIAETAGFTIGDLAVVKVRAWRSALDLVLAGEPPGEVVLEGHRVTEVSARLGLERALHDLAALVPTRAHRYALIDEAHRVRPWSWT